MESTIDQMTDELARRKALIGQMQDGLDRFAKQIAELVGLELTPTTTSEEVVAAVKAALAPKEVAEPQDGLDDFARRVAGALAFTVTPETTPDAILGCLDARLANMIREASKDVTEPDAATTA